MLIQVCALNTVHFSSSLLIQMERKIYVIIVGATPPLIVLNRFLMSDCSVYNRQPHGDGINNVFGKSEGNSRL